MHFLKYRFCLVVLLLSVSLGNVLAQEPSFKKVGTEVRTAVAAQEPVRVVVALKEPSLLQKETVELETLNRRIRRLQAEVLSTVSSSEFRVAHRYNSVPALAGTLTSEAALERLAEHPNVRRIDRDVGGRGHLDTSVEIIRADRWHEEDVTGANTRVAVLDSGIDSDHDDLADDLVHEACFLNFNGEGQCPNGSDRQTGSGAAEDDAGHGTSVSGIVTSNGTQAPRGVAPDAGIVAIKVLNSNTRFSDFSEIVAALDYVINHPELGIRVVNMSLGTSAQFSSECDETTSWNMAGASAVNRLRAEGVLPIASSGNDSSDSELESPACLSGVVSVGATDDEDTVTGFTNSTSFLDLVAPGAGIQTSELGNGTTPFTGTSAAAPHAAGCAALLLEDAPSRTPDEIETALKVSPVRVTDPKNGLTFPRLDCYSLERKVAVKGVGAALTSGAEGEAPTVPFSFHWQTTLEKDSEGFIVERRFGPLTPEARRTTEGWTQVDFVASKAPEGASTDTLRYRYEGEVPAPGQYAFRLRHVTSDGPASGRLIGAAASLDVPLGGTAFLGGPQPNPSRGTAEIEVVVEKTQAVRIGLYDALGRRVRTLYNDRLRAKTPLLLRTEGRSLASGTYFLRVRGETFVKTRKMIVVQ